MISHRFFILCLAGIAMILHSTDAGDGDGLDEVTTVTSTTSGPGTSEKTTTVTSTSSGPIEVQAKPTLDRSPSWRDRLSASRDSIQTSLGQRRDQFVATADKYTGGRFSATTNGVADFVQKRMNRQNSGSPTTTNAACALPQETPPAVKP